MVEVVDLRLNLVGEIIGERLVEVEEEEWCCWFEKEFWEIIGVGDNENEPNEVKACVIYDESK